MPYYKNLSKNDLIISDIGITIRVGRTEDPRQLNPSLSDAQLHESESIGGIYRAITSKKMVKVHNLPKNDAEYLRSKLKEADKPIPSRTRVGIAIDPKKKQYIEELTGILDEKSLSKFTDYADGFAEPEIEFDEGGVLVESEQSASSTTNSRYVDIKARY